MIEDCLEDNFDKLLDRSYYVAVNPKLCSHRHYGHRCFYDCNPLANPNQYRDLRTRVDGLCKILNSPDPKLFVALIINNPTLPKDFTAEQKALEALRKQTLNARLLVIYQMVQTPELIDAPKHLKLYQSEDLIAMGLLTQSQSNGKAFELPEDNDLLDQILMEAYSKVELPSLGEPSIG